MLVLVLRLGMRSSPVLGTNGGGWGEPGLQQPEEEGGN